MPVARGDDVLEDGHARKQPDVLKRPRYSEPRYLVRLQSVHTRAHDTDVARRRLIHAGQEIEDRGLARAVRADETVDLTLTNVHIQLVHRDKTAETNRGFVGYQDRCISVTVGHLFQTSGVLVSTSEPFDERADLGSSQNSLWTDDHRQDQDQRKDDKPQIGEFEGRSTDLNIRKLPQNFRQECDDNRSEDRT